MNNDDLAMNADNGDESDLPSEEQNKLLMVIRTIMTIFSLRAMMKRTTMKTFP